MEPVQNKYSYSETTAIGNRRKSNHQRNLFNYFLPELADGSTVVEIGSGRGEFAMEVRSRGLHYLGIEPSSDLCAGLRERGFEVINEVVPPMPLEDQTVGLVHSHDFVEHLVDYREVMHFFIDSYRVLKHGGFISVLAPNYDTIKQLFFQYDYQHSFIVTKNRIEHMLRDSGFVVKASRCYLMSLSPRLKAVDRTVAHTALPILVNSFSQALMRLVATEEFAFRVNKNLFDHVAVLGMKP